MAVQAFDFSQSYRTSVYLTTENSGDSITTDDQTGRLAQAHKLLGLGNIVKMFKFYGLRLDVDSTNGVKAKSKNRLIIGLNFLIIIFGIILSLNALIRFILTSQFNVNNVCLWLGVHTVQYLVLGCYFHICVRFNVFSNHFNCLLAVITRMRLGRGWPHFIQKVKSGVTMVGVFNVLMTLSLAAIFVTCGELMFTYSGELVVDVIQRVQEIVTVIWILFVASIHILLTLFFIFVCKLLSLIVDYYVTRNVPCNGIVMHKKQSIAYHQHKHQTLMVLVQHADAMFSTFMMATLVHEIMVIIICIQSLQSQLVSAVFTPSAILAVLEIVALIAKNLVCSSLNSKLKSSLTLTNLQNSVKDLENCSAEHINYILYLNEQLINRREMTYGGFFPIKKTFIFTIAGTALTYAIVLHGMS